MKTVMMREVKCNGRLFVIAPFPSRPGPDDFANISKAWEEYHKDDDPDEFPYLTHIEIGATVKVDLSYTIEALDRISLLGEVGGTGTIARLALRALGMMA